MAATVSAQVVMRTRGGPEPITAATLREHQPAAADVEAAQRVFRDAGFDVGPMVGISFSITAPADVFERVFRVRLGAMRSYELPLGVLPDAAGRVVQAVTFTPPPDFGPVGIP